MLLLSQSNQCLSKWRSSLVGYNAKRGIVLVARPRVQDMGCSELDLRKPVVMPLVLHGEMESCVKWGRANTESFDAHLNTEPRGPRDDATPLAKVRQGQ